MKGIYILVVLQALCCVVPSLGNQLTCRICYSCTYLLLLSRMQAGAQEKFMRIKQAYNTLLNSKSRGRYDARNQGSDFSYSASGEYQKTQESEEEFYGLGKITYTSILTFYIFMMLNWFPSRKSASR